MEGLHRLFGARYITGAVVICGFRGWRRIRVCELMNSRKCENKSKLGGGKNC
ncbi:hypothetical protein Goklo_016118 [Gossypium klotzschianum]|uniref:Uncharacterized protein n=1 Tax=Gossypium klotzschianum TaxID=34286 RepID=A0A7J8UCZ0_9ROSI|nr:hypothetical protein [Gossypium klotzschianum]